MKKRQAYNPFLPLDEYIPDGEPHVFGDRVYLFGSHDKENGETYCMLPYQVYSAPVDDLGNWTSPGISYFAEQDPRFDESRHHMYAPDVVRGNDGRFYLYYCFGGYEGPINVAVSDTPDGRYEYLGTVQNPDGTVYKRFIPFDPAVMNDEGTIRLYYGTLYPFEDARTKENSDMFDQIQSRLFGMTREELKSEPGGVMGPVGRNIHFLKDHPSGKSTEPIISSIPLSKIMNCATPRASILTEILHAEEQSCLPEM